MGVTQTHQALRNTPEREGEGGGAGRRGGAAGGRRGSRRGGATGERRLLEGEGLLHRRLGKLTISQYFPKLDKN